MTGDERVAAYAPFVRSRYPDETADRVVPPDADWRLPRRATCPRGPHAHMRLGEAACAALTRVPCVTTSSDSYWCVVHDSVMDYGRVQCGAVTRGEK